MRIRELLSAKNNDFYQHPIPLLAFLGDSVTHGVFEVFEGIGERFDLLVDHKEVYHAKLQRKLHSVFPNTPITIHNAGISGDSAQGGLRRLERDILRYKPDLTVVCFGLNDSGRREAGLKDYAEGLRGIFRRLQAEEIETIFMTPNMKNTYVHPQVTFEALRLAAEDCADQQNQGIMDTYMDCARQVCHEEGVPVADVYRRWKQFQEAGADITVLLSNWINHPIRELHHLFADVLFDLIMLD
jgi:acyl-CoA thioesterase-1